MWLINSLYPRSFHLFEFRYKVLPRWREYVDSTTSLIGNIATVFHVGGENENVALLNVIYFPLNYHITGAISDYHDLFRFMAVNGTKRIGIRGNKTDHDLFSGYDVAFTTGAQIYSGNITVTNNAFVELLLSGIRFFSFHFIW